jgi:hypothetical protein
MNGFWERVAFAFRCFFSILFHADIPNDIAQKLVKRAGPVPQAATVAAPSVSRLKEAERPASEAFDRAVQMLALLQRDGRLIDFLAENISAYPDAQIGAAVRTIHDTCRQVLDQYVKLVRLFHAASVRIVRHVKVRSGLNPYDPSWTPYLSRRYAVAPHRARS